MRTGASPVVSFASSYAGFPDLFVQRLLTLQFEVHPLILTIPPGSLALSSVPTEDRTRWRVGGVFRHRYTGNYTSIATYDDKIISAQ